MKRLLLFGYFGLENFGDDLLLWTICLRLGRLVEKGAIELTILSKSPYYNLPIPACYIPRKNHLMVLRAIKRADIVCAPGGGLLQDKTSIGSLLYYLGIIQTAKSLRKKVALIAQGIGPLTSSVGRVATKAALDSVDYLSVRDHGSASQLESIGLKRNIEITSDLTFALKKTLIPGEIRPALNEENNKFNILFCLKPDRKSEQQIASIASATHLLRRIVQNKDVHFGYAPLHQEQDTDLTEAVSSYTNGETFDYNSANPMSEYTYFDWADVVVSYRLHGCILAAQTKRPFVALTYDPKVQAVADIFNMPSINPDSLTGENLADAVEQSFRVGFGDNQLIALNNAIMKAECDIDALLALINP